MITWKVPHKGYNGNIIYFCDLNAFRKITISNLQKDYFVCFYCIENSNNELDIKTLCVFDKLFGEKFSSKENAQNAIEKYIKFLVFI